MPRFYFLLFLFCTQAVSLVAQTSLENTEKAVKMMDKEKYEEAIKFLGKCIEQEVTNPHYFYLRGICFFALQKRDQGIQDMSWAVKLGPDSMEYRISRSDMYRDTGKHGKALDDLDAAATLARNAEDSSVVYGKMALCVKVLGDTARAIALAEKAILLDSGVFTLHTYAHVLKDSRDRLDEALAIMLKLATIDSTDATIFMNIGFMYVLKGDYEKSIPYFDKTILLDPGDPLAYNNRGFAKLQLGDQKGAMTDVRKSLKLFPNNPYAYRNLGLIYIATGDPEKACEAFDTALKYGFTKFYGPEVMKLKKENCN